MATDRRFIERWNFIVVWLSMRKVYDVVVITVPRRCIFFFASKIVKSLVSILPFNFVIFETFERISSIFALSGTAFTRLSFFHSFYEFWKTAETVINFNCSVFSFQFSLNLLAAHWGKNPDSQDRKRSAINWNWTIKAKEKKTLKKLRPKISVQPKIRKKRS